MWPRGDSAIHTIMIEIGDDVEVVGRGRGMQLADGSKIIVEVGRDTMEDVATVEAYYPDHRPVQRQYRGWMRRG